jgi:hypothetical protein
MKFWNGSRDWLGLTFLMVHWLIFRKVQGTGNDGLYRWFTSWFLNEILWMVQSVGWFEMVALVSIYHEENTWIP